MKIVKMEEPEIFCRKKLIVGEQIYGLHNSRVHVGMYGSDHVAVKILPPPPARNFDREIRVLASVNHENIVKFIGGNPEENMIITEFLSGGTLKAFLERIRPEPLLLREAIRFALDISRAMAYLHDKNIVHRDLNPENIMITEGGERAVLIDFGLAREENVSGMTTEVGSCRWIAPEVFATHSKKLQRIKPYDHKADVYSFAMVLWELITNKTPFHRMQDDRISYNVRMMIMRPTLSSKKIDIPYELSNLLELCWANSPASRPEFSEITATLEGIFLKLDPAQTSAPTTLAEDDEDLVDVPAISQILAVDNFFQVQQQPPNSPEDDARREIEGGGDVRGTQEEKAKEKKQGWNFFPCCCSCAAQPDSD